MKLQFLWKQFRGGEKVIIICETYFLAQQIASKHFTRQ